MVPIDLVVSTSLDGDDSSWTAHGQWWLPSSPEHKVGGVLTMNTDGRFDLVLSGGLDVDPFSRDQTILGLTGNNERLTASEVYLSGARRAGFGEDASHTEQRWRGWTLFRGAHFPEGTATPFSSVSISTDRLSEWCPASLPMTNREGRKTIVEIEEPDPVRANTELGGISIVWPQRESISVDKGVSIAMHPKLVLEPNSPLTLDDLWSHFTMPMLFFLTLCTASPNYVHEIQVTVGDPSHFETFGTAAVITSKWRSNAVQEESHYWEHLIPFALVRPQFEQICVTWLNIMDEYRVPLLEFFSVMLERSMFLEDSFLRVVRAIEVWHRLRFGGQILPAVQFKDLMNRLEGSLPTEEWDLVRMRLQFGNEWSLKSRLDDLISRGGEPIAAIMQGGYKRFSRRVVDARNQLTHGGGDEVSPLTDQEMIWARQTLEMVFILDVLDALGVGENSSELVRKTNLWRALTSEFNLLSSN